MSRKDLANVNADLTKLAQDRVSRNSVISEVPTTAPEPAPPTAKQSPEPQEPVAVVKEAKEKNVQFSFGLRESLRNELQVKAMEEGMTMRSYVLTLLKKKGLNITKDDLVDKRKVR